MVVTACPLVPATRCLRSVDLYAAADQNDERGSTAGKEAATWRCDGHTQVRRGGRLGLSLQSCQLQVCCTPAAAAAYARRRIPTWSIVIAGGCRCDEHGHHRGRGFLFPPHLAIRHSPRLSPPPPHWPTHSQTHTQSQAHVSTAPTMRSHRLVIVKIDVGTRNLPLICTSFFISHA